MGNNCTICKENNEFDVNANMKSSSSFKINSKLHESGHGNPGQKRNTKLKGANGGLDLPEDVVLTTEHNPLSLKATEMFAKFGVFQYPTREEKSKADGNIYKYEEGETYEGEFLNGAKHGRGKIVWTDGSMYEGMWLNNMRHGFGRVIYSEGDCYQGIVLQSYAEILFKFQVLNFFDFLTFSNFLLIFRDLGSRDGSREGKVLS